MTATGLFQRTIVCAALAACVMFTPPPQASAHSGGLAADGCHNDRKQGGRHCHRPGASRKGSVENDAAANAAADYNRKDWHPRWEDTDGDCQNTRQEVLIAESVTPPRLDAKGCRVLSGEWRDPYTGQTFTDPGQLDIDHFIPLAEAHRSGGSAWSREKKRAFANDLTHPDTLIAVYKGANRSKGARDPARWLPPNKDYHCAYVRTWKAAKARWGLVMDGDERAAVGRILAGCR